MSWLSNENFVHFPTCKELKNTVNTESVLSFTKSPGIWQQFQVTGIVVKGISGKICDFSHFEYQFALFSALFIFDVTSRWNH